MDASWKFTIGICLIFLVVGADNIYTAYTDYQEDISFINRSFESFDDVLTAQTEFYLEVLGEYCAEPSY